MTPQQLEDALARFPIERARAALNVAAQKLPCSSKADRSTDQAGVRVHMWDNLCCVRLTAGGVFDERQFNASVEEVARHLLAWLKGEPARPAGEA